MWLIRERICLQCGRPRFYPWVGKIPSRREKLPTPVFWPREFHRLYSPWGLKETDMTEWLSLHFIFLMLSFKPTFSLSSFTFTKRLFSSSLLSGIKVVSSASLRLLIFSLAILIPACASFSPAFLMIYCACKLNKQGDNIEPQHTPFPIWNQSVVPCPVLFLPDLHIDFSRGRSGGLVFPSPNTLVFPKFVVIHTVKGFGIVNKAEVDVFLEFSCFFDDPMDIGSLISGSSAFSKTSLNIWKFTVHILLKPTWRILSITLLACEMTAIV